MDQRVELTSLDMHRQAGPAAIAWLPAFVTVDFRTLSRGIAAVFERASEPGCVSRAQAACGCPDSCNRAREQEYGSAPVRRAWAAPSTSAAVRFIHKAFVRSKD